MLKATPRLFCYSRLPILRAGGAYPNWASPRTIQKIHTCFQRQIRELHTELAALEASRSEPLPEKAPLLDHPPKEPVGWPANDPKEQARIFAHVFPGRFLQRSYYEGSTVESSARFIQAWLDHLHAQGHFEPQMQALLRDLSLEFEEIIQRDAALHRITTIADLETFSAETAVKIAALEEGKSYLLPGGFLIFKGVGHAMLYEFQRKGDKITFRVFNTGIGSGNHEQASQAHKQKLAPILSVTSVPISEISEAFLQTLLEPCIVPLHCDPESQIQNANQLVDCIYQAIYALPGTIERQHPLGIYITPQRAGTCSYESLMVYIRSRCPSLAIFEQIRFCIRTETLQQAQSIWLKKLESNPDLLSESIYQSYASLMQHASQLLLSDSVKPVFLRRGGAWFSKQEALRAQEIGHGCLAGLSLLKSKWLQHKMKNPPLLEWDPGSVFPSKEIQSAADGSKSLNPADNTAKALPVSFLKTLKAPRPNTLESFLESHLEQLKAGETSSSKKELFTYVQRIIELLPIPKAGDPKDFWNQVPASDLQQCKAHLSALHKYYFWLSDEESSSGLDIAIPANQNIAFAFMAMVHALGVRLFPELFDKYQLFSFPEYCNTQDPYAIFSKEEKTRRQELLHYFSDFNRTRSSLPTLFDFQRTYEDLPYSANDPSVFAQNLRKREMFLFFCELAKKIPPYQPEALIARLGLNPSNYSGLTPIEQAAFALLKAPSSSLLTIEIPLYDFFAIAMSSHFASSIAQRQLIHRDEPPKAKAMFASLLVKTDSENGVYKFPEILSYPYSSRRSQNRWHSRHLLEKYATPKNPNKVLSLDLPDRKPNSWSAPRPPRLLSEAESLPSQEIRNSQEILARPLQVLIDAEHNVAKFASRAEQAVFLLDFFRSNSQKDSVELVTPVEILCEEPAFVQRVGLFIETGIDHFWRFGLENQKNLQAALFFVQMARMISPWISSPLPPSLQPEFLRQFLRSILKNEADALTFIEKQGIYLALFLSYEQKNPTECTEQEIEEFLSAWFLLDHHAFTMPAWHPIHSIFTFPQVAWRFFPSLVDRLKKSPALAHTIAKKIAQSKGCNGNSLWTFDADNGIFTSFFQQNKYSLHLQTGLFCLNDSATKTSDIFPSHMLPKDALSLLFGERKHSTYFMVKQDGGSRYFVKEFWFFHDTVWGDIELRRTQGTNDYYVLRTDPKTGRQYQFIPYSKKEENIPKILQKSSIAWSPRDANGNFDNTLPFLLCDQRSGTPLYQFSLTTSALTRGNQWLLPTPELLKKIENPQAILVWGSKTGTIERVEYPLLVSKTGSSLCFDVVFNEKTKLLEALWNENPEYVLAREQTEGYLKFLPSYLLLEHRSSKERKILVSFSPVASTQKDLSFSTHLVERKLENQITDTFNTIPFFTFDIVDQKPVAKSHLDRLFLAYLFLAQRDYQTAQEYLSMIPPSYIVPKELQSQYDQVIDWMQNLQNESVEAGVILLQAERISRTIAALPNEPRDLKQLQKLGLRTKKGYENAIQDANHAPLLTSRLSLTDQASVEQFFRFLIGIKASDHLHPKIPPPTLPLIAEKKWGLSEEEGFSYFAPITPHSLVAGKAGSVAPNFFGAKVKYPGYFTNQTQQILDMLFDLTRKGAAPPSFPSLSILRSALIDDANALNVEHFLKIYFFLSSGISAEERKRISQKLFFILATTPNFRPVQSIEPFLLLYYFSLLPNPPLPIPREEIADINAKVDFASNERATAEINKYLQKIVSQIQASVQKAIKEKTIFTSEIAAQPPLQKKTFSPAPLLPIKYEIAEKFAYMPALQKKVSLTAQPVPKLSLPTAYVSSVSLLPGENLAASSNPEWDEVLLLGRNRRKQQLRFVLNESQNFALLQAYLVEQAIQANLEVAKLEQEIFAAAYPRPSLPEARIQEQAAILSSHYPVSHTIASILGVFLEGTYASFKEAFPTCSDAQIENVNALIQQFLIHSAHLQKIERALQKLSPILDGNKEPLLIHELGEELSAEIGFDSSWREGLVFEYVSNKRLRPQQIAYLQEILQRMESPNPFILSHMIMGGGKTDVFASLLGRLFAEKGKQLALFLTPASQIQTAKNNLESSQWNLFRQEVFSFDFTREELTEETCAYIEKNLTRALQTGALVVLKSEMPQILELEYIASRAKDLKNLDPRIPILANILSILREKTAAIIDEADEVLRVDRDTNFPSGEKITPTHQRVFLVSEMYRLLHECSKETNIDLFGSQQNAISEETFKTQIVPLLARKISKIDFFSFIPQQYQDAFVRYLIGSIDPKSEDQVHRTSFWGKDKDVQFLQWRDHLAATDIEKAHFLALAKMVAQNILPHTLTKTVNRNFGRKTESSGKVVPYVATKVPGTTEYSNPWELVSYHFQTALATPFSQELFAHFIQRMEAEAKEEQANFRLPIQQTPIGKLVFERLQIPLQDLFDPLKQKASLEKCLQDPLKRIFIEMILIQESVSYDPYYYASNGHNLAMFPKAMIMTGTVYNRFSYPSLFAQDPILDPGAEGALIDLLIQRNGKIHTVENAGDLSGILQEAIQSSPQQIRAVIDVGGTLLDKTNEEYALDILSVFANDPSVQGVVFFKISKTESGAKKQLCLLKKGMKTAIELPNTHLSTWKALGIDPASLFFFYDQWHSRGTDFPLPPKTVALTLLNGKDPLHAILQGVARCRKIHFTQDVVYAIPKSAAQKIAEEPLTIATVLRKSFELEQKMLEEHVFRHYSQEMHHAVRSYHLAKVLQGEPLDVKLLRTVEEDSPYVQAGKIPRNISALQALQAIYDRLVSEYGKIEPLLIQKLDRILENAQKDVKRFPAEVPSVAHGLGREKEVETQTETQQEKEIETQQQVEQEIEQERNAYATHVNVGLHVETPWTEELAETLFIESQRLPFALPDKQGAPLRTMIASFPHAHPFETIFTENLLATHNWNESRSVPVSICCPVHKPAKQMLVFERMGKTVGILVSLAESEFFRTQFIPKHPELKLWLVDTSGRSIGKTKAPLPQITELLLQMNLLSGNIDFLMRNYNTFLPWIYRSPTIAKIALRLLFIQLKNQEDKTKFQKAVQNPLLRYYDGGIEEITKKFRLS